MPRTPPALPKRVRRKDAEDVADELIAKILLQRERYALFITPMGSVMTCPVLGVKFAHWCETCPLSLVGVYDIEVERDSLIDEIEGCDAWIGRATK